MPMLLNANDNLFFLQKICDINALYGRRFLDLLKSVNCSSKELSMLKNVVSSRDAHKLKTHLRRASESVKRVNNPWETAQHACPQHFEEYDDDVDSCYDGEGSVYSFSSSSCFSTSRWDGPNSSTPPSSTSINDIDNGQYRREDASATDACGFSPTSEIPVGAALDGTHFKETSSSDDYLVDDSHLQTLLQMFSKDKEGFQSELDTVLNFPWLHDGEVVVHSSAGDGQMWKLLNECQRGLVYFMVKAVDVEVRKVNCFSDYYWKTVAKIEPMVGNAESLSTKLSVQLRNHTNVFLSGVVEYENACTKLKKLEKNLENAVLRCNPKQIPPVDSPKCGYKGCKAVTAEHVAIYKCITSDPSDFARYTNYVEQVCFAGHLFDLARENEDVFVANLNKVLKDFCEVYPIRIHQVQVSCIGNLAYIPSVYLEFYLELKHCLSQILPALAGFAKFLEIKGVYPLRLGKPDFGSDKKKVGVNVNNSPRSHVTTSTNEDVGASGISNGISPDDAINASAAGIFTFLRNVSRRLTVFNEVRCSRLEDIGYPQECFLASATVTNVLSMLLDHHCTMHQAWKRVYECVAEVCEDHTGNFTPTFNNRFLLGNDLSLHHVSKSIHPKIHEHYCNPHNNRNVSSGTTVNVKIVLTLDFFERLAQHLDGIVADGISSCLQMSETMLGVCAKVSRWEQVVARVANINGVNRHQVIAAINEIVAHEGHATCAKADTLANVQTMEARLFGMDIESTHFVPKTNAPDSPVERLEYDVGATNAIDKVTMTSGFNVWDRTQGNYKNSKDNFGESSMAHKLISGKPPAIVLARTFQALTLQNIHVNGLLRGSQFSARALVDYSETGYGFEFKRGDAIHVRIAGGTSLWYGHTSNGINRWFPAKFVEPLPGCEPGWYRKADLQSITHLDRFAKDSDAPPDDAKFLTQLCLSPKNDLKQSFNLAKLGLEGRVEREVRCSLCRRINLRGTLYISKSHIGFISSFNDSTIFGQQTTWIVSIADISRCYTGSRDGRFSFYFKIALKNGDVQKFHSMLRARRICNDICAIAGLTRCNADNNDEETEEEDEDDVDNEDEEAEKAKLLSLMDDTNDHTRMQELFSDLPGRTLACENELDISLEEFVKTSFQDNVDPKYTIASTRMMQNAFEFSGDLDQVMFDWNQVDKVQFATRKISYKLRQDRTTSVIPKIACGIAHESLSYVLAKAKVFCYQSVVRLEDIPYCTYFYTVIRVTATALEGNKTHVKAEHKVEFVKNTVFVSVIRSEASERLDAAAEVLCRCVNINDYAGANGSKPRRLGTNEEDNDDAHEDEYGDGDVGNESDWDLVVNTIIRGLGKRILANTLAFKHTWLTAAMIISFTGICIITLKTNIRLWSMQRLFG